MADQRPTLQCPCDDAHTSVMHTYTERPDGEVAFDLGETTYRRDLRQCELCRHVFSRHDMDMSALYSGQYVDATYGGTLRATFDRIVGLPPASSDNVGRAAHVDAFAQLHLPELGRRPRLLDVGSGLAVFPHRMRTAHGWDCVALDPDARAAAHARDVAGVEAICGDFMEVDVSEHGQFDAITFNKVLEHVVDPVAMLARALPLLHDHGFAYIEMPDAEGAGDAGPAREEFFIDHHHVFSAASLTMLTDRAGLRLLGLQRLQEPSTKYTLRSFAVPVREGHG